MKADLNRYEDPWTAEIYDYQTQGVGGDVEFWRDLARRADSSALELACGTGRVLVPLARAGVQVTGVGKIRDIYAGVGVNRSITTEGNQDGLDRLVALLDEKTTGLVFSNLIDFDMRFGHRRNPSGYTHSLEEFDQGLSRLMERMTPDDLLLITADHGCDPTFTAHTDHTREYVPVIMWSPRFTSGGDLGTRETFADLGATVADALGAEWYGPGRSFLPG